MPESSVSIFQGMRGSGKTNGAKTELKTVSPLFVVDIRKDYTHLPIQFFSHRDFMLWVQSNQVAMNSQPNKMPKRVQIRFHFTEKDDLTALFYSMKYFQNCTIVIDEADAIFTVTDWQKPLTDVFLGSRNNNINLYFMTKRPSLLPILVRSQADRFVVFCTEEQWDIDYLSKRLRKQFPKDPFKLAMGEAIILKQGEQPFLHKYPKFIATASPAEELDAVPTGRRKIKLNA